MKFSNIIIGIGLIILGLIFLSENFGYVEFDFGQIWPVFVILGGVGFWLGFLQDRKNYGLIMPATILTVYGLLFLYCSYDGWYNMQYLWPWFMIGPGIGFFFMYSFGEKDRGLLVPAGILSGIGLLFLFRHTGLLRYWPVILIIVGLVLILKHYRGENKKNENL